MSREFFWFIAVEKTFSQVFSAGGYKLTDLFKKQKTH